MVAFKDCQHFGEKKYDETSSDNTHSGIERIIVKKGYLVEVRSQKGTYESKFENEESMFNYVYGIVKGAGYNPTSIHNGTPEQDPLMLRDDSIPKNVYDNLLEHILNRI